jgi:hypothetical protein
MKEDDKKQFYLGNPNVKKQGVIQEYTDEQVKEYIKCSKSNSYFINKYYKMVTIDHGLQQIKLRDYQEKIVTTVNNNRMVIVVAPRQQAKCTVINTMVTVRNKKTLEVSEMTIGELYDIVRRRQSEPNHLDMQESC